MTITNGYVSLAEINYKMGYTSTDADRDAYVEKVIEGVSRWIDKRTNRRFYAAEETRYYSPEFGDVVFVDDILSVTSLKTDSGGDRDYSNVWQTTDYDLLPANSAPYLRIQITPSGSYSFPIGTKTVELTGKFGYCEAADLPDDIYRACFLGVLRLIKRDNTPLGIAGAGAVGVQAVHIRDLVSDPDVSNLLAPFIRYI